MPVEAISLGKGIAFAAIRLELKHRFRGWAIGENKLESKFIIFAARA